jgi:hypothetical protein
MKFQVGDLVTVANNNGYLSTKDSGLIISVRAANQNKSYQYESVYYVWLNKGSMLGPLFSHELLGF